MYKMLFFFLIAGSALSGQDVLDAYIQKALNSNLALQQSEFSYQKSVAALREARGMFLPSVDIEARYTRADGGRTIDFPIGDLLNPIYQTLNLLTGVPAFPTNLQNESIKFFREKEHETKVRIVQPVFQPQIYYNVKIQKQITQIQSASRNAYARQLVADVKTSYYNVLTAAKVVELTEKTNDVLNENLRVSTSLFENDKVTQDVVYRAQAELSRLNQQQAEAHKLFDLSQAYFNFLLNRPLDSPVEIAKAPLPQFRNGLNRAEKEANALAHREELVQLKAAIDAQRNGVKLNRSGFLPGLIAVFDYGYQGEEYNFNKEYDYWMASAVLQWNLFKGGQDKACIQQAKLEQAKLETQLLELKKKIQLDVWRAVENVNVVDQSIKFAADELSAAQKNFDIVNKKFEQGMVSHIEFLDAQNTLMQAELNAIIKKFDFFIKQAELEKAAATFALPN
jgi:outer membrane protein